MILRNLPPQLRTLTEAACHPPPQQSANRDLVRVRSPHPLLSPHLGPRVLVGPRVEKDLRYRIAVLVRSAVKRRASILRRAPLRQQQTSANDPVPTYSTRAANPHGNELKSSFQQPLH